MLGRVVTGCPARRYPMLASTRTVSPSRAQLWVVSVAVPCGPPPMWPASSTQLGAGEGVGGADT